MFVFAMVIVAISFSALSLVFSLFACWRSGQKAKGRSTPPESPLELRRLATRHDELLEAAAQLLDDAYARSRQQLAVARELLRRLKRDATNGLEQSAALAHEQAEALSARLEEGMREIRTVTMSVARRTHGAIAQRVFGLKARAMLLFAEAKAKSARSAVMEQRFTEAEQLLDEATELMRRATEELGVAPHCEVMIENIRHAKREAMTSLRAHAQHTVLKMDRLLAESGRLVRQLESEETQAAGRAAAPAGSRSEKNATRPAEATWS